LSRGIRENTFALSQLAFSYGMYNTCKKSFFNTP
jgi:hypothetical protein